MQSRKLVWQFWSDKDAPTALPQNYDRYSISDDTKWEQRFFWRHDAPITLNGFHGSELEVTGFRFKRKEDVYILTPNRHNIKIRNDKIAYKPLLSTTDQVYAYGKKQKFKAPSPELAKLLPIMHKWDPQVPLKTFLQAHFTLVPTYKETYSKLLHKNLKAKVELARVEIAGISYLSFCIEAKNLELVKELGQTLVPDQTPIDFIEFIEKIAL